MKFSENDLLGLEKSGVSENDSASLGDYEDADEGSSQQGSAEASRKGEKFIKISKFLEFDLFNCEFDGDL